MKLIDANIMLLFVLLPYLSSPYKSSSVKDFSSSLTPYKSNFVKDFPSSVRIHKSILMSSVMKNLQRSVKFWQPRKKRIVDFDSKLQEHL